ncbi:MAG: hypothetical protein ABIT47_01945 [Candidatus Paceibacterota bacterium]
MAQETTPKIEYRIGLISGGFMIMTAIVLDCVQVLLAFTGVLVLASDLITFIAAPTFGIWFLMMRVNYFGGKKAMVKVTSMLTTLVVELVPIVDALPGITMGVVTVIFATRSEDRQKSAVVTPKRQQSKTVRLNPQQQPSGNSGRSVERITGQRNGQTLVGMRSQSGAGNASPNPLRGRSRAHDIQATKPAEAPQSLSRQTPPTGPVRIKPATEPRAESEILAVQHNAETLKVEDRERELERTARETKIAEERKAAQESARIKKNEEYRRDKEEAQRKHQRETEEIERKYQENLKQYGPVVNGVENDPLFKELNQYYRRKRPDKIPEQIGVEVEREFERRDPKRVAAYAAQEKTRIYQHMKDDPVYKKFFLDHRYDGRGRDERDPHYHHEFRDELIKYYPEKARAYAQGDEELTRKLASQALKAESV